MAKQLQSDSLYAQYDVDGDGIVSDEEIARSERMIMLENEDKRQDAQRNMAWFALFGMLLYPLAIVLTVWLKLDTAGSLLGNMAPTYFVSVAAIVAAFYGTQAYSSGKKAPAAAPVSSPAPKPAAKPAPKKAPAAEEEIKIVRKRK
jgi:hypothetical protein